MSHSVNQVQEWLRSRGSRPSVDLLDFIILSLNFSVGVDAIGAETDFTIEKYWKDGHYRGHHVVNKWKICDDKIGHVEGWET